jgi:hypothetical protein
MNLTKFQEGRRHKINIDSHRTHHNSLHSDSDLTFGIIGAKHLSNDCGVCFSKSCPSFGFQLNIYWKYNPPLGVSWLSSFYAHEVQISIPFKSSLNSFARLIQAPE